jgi:AcrR family transcriptional regulator
VVDRRRQILDAAFAAFLAKGYFATSLEDIRAGSGASTGSIYHAFKGKAAIAVALFAEAVEAWGEATAKAARDTRAPDAAIRALVEGLVDWGLACPDQFRLMDEMRFLEQSPELSDRLAEGRRAAEQAYGVQVEAGEVRDLPWPVARALTLGRAYEFLRQRPSAPGTARRVLSDAAWAAIRAPRPASRATSSDPYADQLALPLAWPDVRRP